MVAGISSVKPTINFFMNLFPVSFRHTLSFKGVDVLATRPIPKMEDHPLPAVREFFIQ